jgi:hypothetical protein
MTKGVLFMIIAVFFLISLSVLAKADISASALDVVIKENNDLLQKNIAGLITQFKDDISNKITGDEFKQFIQAEIRSSLQVERIKISVSVFVSVLLALVVYSLIRFKLRMKEIEIKKIAKLQTKEMTEQDIPTAKTKTDIETARAELDRAEGKLRARRLGLKKEAKKKKNG